jgi:hypothetical protein
MQISIFKTIMQVCINTSSKLTVTANTAEERTKSLKPWHQL